MQPIIDLHCDLLLYLAVSEERTPFDLDSRASLKDMHKGGVKLQTCAFFSESERHKDKSQTLEAQLRCYQKLLTDYSSYYRPIEQDVFNLNTSGDSRIVLLPAIENADILCVSQDEPLSTILTRFDQFLKIVRHVLYISLTWNGESRFGGGTGSSIGLKGEGKELLRYLKGKNIAVDISHASDKLAEDIFNLIDQESLNLTVIASHSNFRAICPHLRNLPDEFALEIQKRQGVIGLNLYNKFVCPQRKDPFYISHHVHHALKLGLEDTLCFGADFFCEKDDITGLDGCFFDNWANSSCYPQLLQEIESRLSLPYDLNKLAYGNALSLFKQTLFSSAGLR